MCSRRFAERGRDRRGVSLLECLVAIVILSISMLGLSRLVVDNERLLAKIESWCAFEPEYYVVRPAYDLERTLGCPARLSTSAGGAVGGVPTDTPFHVIVLSRSRNLHPESATAIVEVVEP
jgi:prepilin-type N-terminal cleavage/methylation domain-containing protein